MPDTHPFRRLLPAVLLLVFLTNPVPVGAQTAGAQPRAVDVPVERADITDNDCLECHGIKGYATPTGLHGETEKRRLDLDMDAVSESVHGELQCVACHTDIERLPHRKQPLAKVDCQSCHDSLHADSEDLVEAANTARVMAGTLPTFKPRPSPAKARARDYAASLHAAPSKDDPTRPNAACTDCHGTHYVFPADDHRALSNRLASPEVCGGCHREALEKYRGSVHGAALKTPWKGESATCADCHTAHTVDDAQTMTTRRVVTAKCGTCHAEALESYMDTYHGQMAWLGGKKAATCAECHRPHDTRAIDDDTSRVAPANKLATCQRCHKEAGANFAKFAPHATTTDWERYPAMWLVAKGMLALVCVVLVFFYGHSILWWRRERQEAHAGAPSGHGAGDGGEGGDGPRLAFRRFSWPWRLNHWVLALSVMTLTFTGMAAMYADAGWAVPVVTALGGPENFAVIHRIAAVAFGGAIIGHTVAVLGRIALARRGRFTWFGPDSLLPRRQDIADMAAQLRWFLGRGPKPRFDRWTYWEKFDYWAVYWGAVVIGLSGLVLWFPKAAAEVLPGWAFNVATIAHGIEAFLAVTTLFVVHFFNNHFRPTKFPLDTVMFTGAWTLEELKDERPAHYDRLCAAGALDDHMVRPPSRAALIVSHVLGFLLIAVGLGLLVLVAVGFVQKGLG